MRKLKSIFLIYSLFLVSTLSVHAESYQLDTSKGPTTLNIPDNPTDLRQAFIDMASLYTEERYAHEDSLTQIDNLTKIIADYKTQVDTLTGTVTSLTDQLQNKKADPFRIFVNGSYRYNIPAPAFNVSFGTTLELFEFLDISLYYEVPTSLRVSFGIRVY